VSTWSSVLSSPGGEAKKHAMQNANGWRVIFGAMENGTTTQQIFKRSQGQTTVAAGDNWSRFLICAFLKHSDIIAVPSIAFNMYHININYCVEKYLYYYICIKRAKYWIKKLNYKSMKRISIRFKFFWKYDDMEIEEIERKEVNTTLQLKAKVQKPFFHLWIFHRLWDGNIKSV
jgi:hypothetical protein